MSHFSVYKMKRETSQCESSCRFLSVTSNSFDTIYRHLINLPLDTIISQFNPSLINANSLSNIHLSLSFPLFSQRPLTNRLLYQNSVGIPCDTVISQFNPSLINANSLSNIHLTLPSPLFSQRPLTNRLLYQNSVGIPCLHYHNYMFISCYAPMFHYLTTLSGLYKSRRSSPFNILN